MDIHLNTSTNQLWIALKGRVQGLLSESRYPAETIAELQTRFLAYLFGVVSPSLRITLYAQSHPQATLRMRTLALELKLQSGPLYVRTFSRGLQTLNPTPQSGPNKLRSISVPNSPFIVADDFTLRDSVLVQVFSLTDRGQSSIPALM